MTQSRFGFCQIWQDTIGAEVRQPFSAGVRDLFWLQSDWTIHPILIRVIWGQGDMHHPGQQLNQPRGEGVHRPATQQDHLSWLELPAGP